MAQWLRIRLPMQGTRVRALVQEVRSRMMCSTAKKTSRMKKNWESLSDELRPQTVWVNFTNLVQQ